MGPLDPPMVTAQGYNDPMQTVGTATSPLDQNAMLAELLRRRTAAAKAAKLSAGNAQMWNNTIGQPQFTQTIRGGSGQPDQVVVNYGDILGKGVSNYMGAKERKNAIEKTSEVEDINNNFMKTTLSNDPTALKLYSAAQAGVPGADKALAEHMAPKKQSLAVLTQFISGGGDPEMARSLASQFGVDPEIAFQAAQYQTKAAEQKANAKFENDKTLQGVKDTAAMDRLNAKPTKTGYTQAELNAMPIQDRIAAVQASTGRESQESKLRAKMKIEGEQDLAKTDYAIKNTADLINMASKAAYYPGNLGMVNPKLTQNSNNAMVEQAIDQLVLDEANGKLGGGVSNADVIFLKNAKTNLHSGNRDTVVAQLNRVLTKLQSHRDQLAKQAGSSSTPPAVKTPSSPYDTTTTRERKNLNAPSFDDIWKEVGGE